MISAEGVATDPGKIEVVANWGLPNWQPVLAYADFSIPFVLEVDASHGGLDVVLSQV